MFCRNCGKQLADGAAFCTACGARLRADNNVNPAPSGMYSNVENRPMYSAYSNSNQRVNELPERGKGYAIASMVLGIVAVVTWFFGSFSFIAVICGIVGLIMASQSKKQGYNGGIRTAGFVLSLIGLIGGSLVFIACVACIGRLAALEKGLSGIYSAVRD